jgi:hypothetical protein
MRVTPAAVTPGVRRALACGLVIALFGACAQTPGATDSGSSDAGPTDAGASDSGQPSIEEGGVAGVPFNPLDSSWSEQNGSGFDFQGTATYVSVSGYSGDCSAWTSNQVPPNGQNLVIGVANTSSTGSATPPTLAGEFTVVNSGSAARAPNSNVAEVYYSGDCLQAISYTGISGSVSLTLVTAQEVRGSYDLVLSCHGFSNCQTNTEAHLVGTFDAASCPQMDINRSFMCADGG